jgi:hypothetical protein
MKEISLAVNATQQESQTGLDSLAKVYVCEISINLKVNEGIEFSYRAIETNSASFDLSASESHYYDLAMLLIADRSGKSRAMLNLFNSVLEEPSEETGNFIGYLSAILKYLDRALPVTKTPERKSGLGMSGLFGDMEMGGGALASQIF